MKKTKKALATLAIAGMLSMIPFNALAESAFPTRLGGYDAAQTAVQIAEQTGWAGTAILASSTSYGMVDALTSGPLAAFLKAPILLQEAGNVLNPDTNAELTKLKVKTVYVTSGTAVISQAVLDQLTGMGIKVVPLGGADRFETSVNIAKQMVALGAPVSKVAVAYGWLNQDALSIAAIAAAQTEPILLTEKDTIPASIEAFLTANTSVKTTDLIGGTAVISDAVKAQLPSATRLSGNTAYDTNLAVLKAFDKVLKYDHVFLANGETAIDALAGVPLAAKYNAGIVLTNGTANDGTIYVKGKMTSAGIVTALGGTAVVPDAVRTGMVSTTPPSTGGGGGGGYYSGGGVTAPDITALSTAVTNANALLNGTTVGAKAGNVTQATHDAFQTAITTATGVKNNTSATQDQVNAQTTALATATTAFNHGIFVAISTPDQAAALSGADASNMVVIDHAIIVTVDGLTIQNATSNYDISLDPGATGKVTLQNVTAKSIIVLSGASSSIDLNNVVAQLLQNQSNSLDVHIHLTGGTRITQTQSTSIYSAIFEAADGSFGTIAITTSSANTPVIELRGTFTDPIIVGGGVAITAAPGANISNVQVNVVAGQPSQAVTLTGKFNGVTVNSQASITVGAQSSIANVVANAATSIFVPAGSSITVDPTGGNITTTGSTGTVQTADKNALTAAINLATPLLNSKTVGTLVGQVPLTAQTTFQAAINAANAVATATAPTQAQINAQLVALSIATTNFNNAVILAPQITDFSSISGATLDSTTNTLSFSLTQLKRTSGIKVSKDSALSLSIGNSGPIGDFSLLASQLNSILSSPLPANLNLSQTNMTAIFDAITKLDPTSKQALLNTVDFAKLLDLVKQSDVATQNAVYQSMGFSDFYKAISGADSATKLRILDNMTAVIDVSLTDSNASAFKASVVTIMLPVLNKVTPALNSAQINTLLNYYGSSNSNLSALLTTLNLTPDQKQSILSNLDFTALFNAVETQLAPTTRATMFQTVNFTDLFNAVKSADSATKTLIYGHMLDVMNVIKTAPSISRVDALNALVFGANNRDALFQVLMGLDPNCIPTVGIVTVTATLTDSASNTNTYIFKISR